MQSVAEDEGNLFFLAEVREQLPGKYALAGDAQSVAEGSNRSAEGIGRRWDVGLNDGVPSAIEHVEGQSPDMEIDAAYVPPWGLVSLAPCTELDMPKLAAGDR